MTRFRTLAALLLLTLASGAGALKLRVFDPELQLNLGYGESSGGRMTVQLVRNYSGPVVLLFSRSEDERNEGLFLNLQPRYLGVLKAGQLTLEVGNTEQTLARFLGGLKPALSVQLVTQSLTLPGLRTATPEKAAPEGGR
ncbi:hypothetical protein QOL99_03730 [Deinococcus sp. MIMF12]|uniref:CHRD domain-containing protein n=1 Tax=Deinococcus rhizophilus TaxID=3049544 RepID=A0ABT7JE89_9DEIO|nr:hypothetical protein [Deinococcus rhizophilus]MDL2343256.1 hypothetical protein [Deinococcus rhizophilus]